LKLNVLYPDFPLELCFKWWFDTWCKLVNRTWEKIESMKNNVINRSARNLSDYRGLFLNGRMILEKV
jgi:hypothetical protein